MRAHVRVLLPAAAAALVLPLAANSTAGAASPLPTSAPQAAAATAWSPIPAYDRARVDHPAIYFNGCNAAREVLTPKPCTMANASAARTVLLFGDSHAAQWYSAVEGAARANGWRFRTLTKSGCSPLAMPISRYKESAPYSECGTWRTRALNGLASGAYGRIDVLVISSWQFHGVLPSWSGGTKLTGAAKTYRWEQALRTTISKSLGSATQVVVLRDSPQLPGDKPWAQRCFVRWQQWAGVHCGQASSKALLSSIWAAERRAVAAYPGRAAAADLTTAQCPSSWCGPLQGRYLLFKDDNHWTQTHVRVHLTSPVQQVLVAAMSRATA
ncbi:MAG: hypothetical protein LCI03_13560 [Actinobacteria bacterium]|nr:hypothetical protein [Actinomycetota bacterium]